jgi:hypothetical protein
MALTLAAANTAATSTEINCFIFIPFSRVVSGKAGNCRPTPDNAAARGRLTVSSSG